MDNNEYNKILIKLSLPILMNYLVTTLFEIMDRAIIGHYSTEAFAAVSIASSVIYAATGSFGVLSVAYNITAAKTLGEGDKEKFYGVLKGAMYISLITGILFSAVFIPASGIIFSKVFSLQANTSIMAKEYFDISTVTVLMNMVIFNFSVYFRNLKKTTVSLFSTVAATGVNIIFDYILVYGKYGFPEFGAKGAAIGSVLGLLAGISVYLVFFFKEQRVTVKRTVVKEVREMIKLFFPLVIQDFIETSLIAFLITAIVSSMGETNIAVYTLAGTVENAVVLPVFAFSSAGVTLCLQKKYAGQCHESAMILRQAVILSVITVIVLGIGSIAFRYSILPLITGNPVVVKKAAQLLVAVTMVSVLRGGYENYKGYIQGVGKEKFVLYTTVSISMFSVVMAVFLSKLFGIGGIYMAAGVKYMILYFIFRKRSLTM